MTILPGVQRTGSGSREIPARSLSILNPSPTAELPSEESGSGSVGRIHRQTAQGEDAAQRDLPAESVRVLSLLDKLPEATVRQAIHGISQWLSAWQMQVVVVPEGLNVWLKLWPIAVEVTNAQQPVGEEIHLDTVMQSSDDHEPMDLDTLNTPAGKLVGVFLAACPQLQGNDRPFDVDGAPS